MKDSTINHPVHQAARGRYRVMVVDSKTKRVKRDFGWQNNLILNQGMDGIATRAWVTSMQYGVAGTGTTPTSDDSGTTTASQAGTTVTLSGGSFVFTSGNVGDMIKWDTLEESRIVSYTDPTHVEVTPSQSVSAAEFTLFRTSQTGLATEVARTYTKLLGTGNSETTYNAAVGLVTHRRTFDFPAETGPVTYSEVGVSWLSTAGANLFSRIKLSSAASLVADDQLRLVYDLQVTVSPFAPRAISPVITGWTGTDGDEMLDYVGLTPMSLATGNDDAQTSVHTNEPFRAAATMISNSTLALPAQFGTGTSYVSGRNGTTRGYKVNTLSAYVAGSFTITKQVVFSVSEGIMTGIRSIAIAGNVSANYYTSMAVLLDNAQVKDGTHSLTLNWVYTWARTLS